MYYVSVFKLAKIEEGGTTTAVAESDPNEKTAKTRACSIILRKSVKLQCAKTYNIREAIMVAAVANRTTW